MKAIDQPHPTVVRFLSQQEALEPSCWIAEVFALETSGATSWPIESNLSATLASNESASLVTIRVPAAIRLKSRAFERAAADAYAAIRDSLHGRRPVRFWNHIPAIHAVMDAERDRYMVFNAGRFRAFESWYGSADAFARQLATASGIGHSGEDLVMHCLALPEPGVAIENPRQIASYRYSRRYGPLPPCFARATTVRSPHDPSGPGLLLVGGTASIRGEDSVHRGRLDRQLDETFENLAALVAAASAQQRYINEKTLTPAPDKSGCRFAPPRFSRNNGRGRKRQSSAVASVDARGDDALSRYRHLRIYYQPRSDPSAIQDAVSEAFTSLRSAEFVMAELCRQELLVEIEGVAPL